MQIQIPLITQFIQRVLAKHGTDFAGIAMQDAQVGMWAVQLGVDQIGHGNSP